MESLGVSLQLEEMEGPDCNFGKAFPFSENGLINREQNAKCGVRTRHLKARVHNLRSEMAPTVVHHLNIGLKELWCKEISPEGYE
ncbi:hypothetical protein VNO77_27298 [Canavalia gladiata]|uniref:Uncharacterized protein n=1 Tax=Canavalia gladiata TaxID=3824 RepID=A0AAN9KUI6_CANGL